jgi:serine/threonine protein kinase
MHRASIAHCDLKPDNVLLEPILGPTGPFLRPLLTDFGVSRIVSQQPLAVKHFAVTHVKAASMRYAAPEIVWTFMRQGELSTEPCIIFGGDVYAFALTLYECLSRRRPWQ